MPTTSSEISATGAARAFWVTSPGHGEIRAQSLPSRKANDVVVRTLYTGISRGTEALVFTGRIPVSEYARMRAPFQEGDFPAPVKYGYANVGVIEDGPRELAGRRVFSLYPHQTRFLIDAGAVRMLPDDVPPERAVLAANLETAVTGVWDAAPTAGAGVIVLGAGTVGCLVAWVLKRVANVAVTMADINPSRSAIAASLGVAFSTPDTLSEADIVIHTSGSPAGLVRALELARPDGLIVEMSWFGDRMVSLPLGGGFHSRRLTIKASQVGSIPPARRGEWTHASRLDYAIQLLSDPALDVLITGESAFEELPVVMARLAASPGGELCHRIRY